MGEILRCERNKELLLGVAFLTLWLVNKGGDERSVPEQPEDKKSGRQLRDSTGGQIKTRTFLGNLRGGRGQERNDVR